MHTNLKLTVLALAAGAGISGLTLEPARGQFQDDPNTYYGQAPVAVDGKTKSPVHEMPDPYGSPLFVDGRTDVALDARSLAAQEISGQETSKRIRQEIDRSIRADIGTGQPVTVLIAPEHFTQLTFLRDGEIVFPRRAFTGQPDLVNIDKKENSPYVYVSASALVPGQTTNMFVETEEDGRIQTYVVNLLVTEPQNIREQVSVNLVDDRTPPIRGNAASGSQSVPSTGIGGAKGPTGTSGAGAAVGGKGQIGASISGKFSEEDVRKYLTTMIEMAESFAEAKAIEKKGGKTIYRDTDIRGYPSGQFSYIDPVEQTSWMVHQVWFFPKYDAILLDVRYENPNQSVSMWDYSQMKWQANNSPTHFSSTAAAPLAMQTLPGRTNRIWYLIQGQRLDPRAEFSPVFPRAERRGTTRTGAGSSEGTYLK
jgi:hypothetical protein